MSCDVLFSVANPESIGDLSQQVKVTVGRNVHSDSELMQLAEALSIPQHVLERIKCDGNNLNEKAGSVVTKWVQTNGDTASEKKFCELLQTSCLAHLLKSGQTGMPKPAVLTVQEEADLLEAYLRYVINDTKYVDMVGTSSAEGSHRLLLDRVYVGLQIDRTVAYERAQQAEQLDSEMKTLLAEKGIQWERLTQDEKRHLIHVYLSELPLSSVDSSIECAEKPIAYAFQENKALVVLGDPGSGKTTMVRWLALKLATAMKAKLTRVKVPQHQVLLTSSPEDKTLFDMGPVRLPILVKISRFANFLTSPNSKPHKTKNALEDFLGTLHHDNKRISNLRGKEIFGEQLHKLMMKYFYDGKVALILDGLDEVVTVSVRRGVVKCVQQLFDDCFNDESELVAQNQIVVTSRIAGYRAAPFLSDCVVHGTVQRMNRQAIDTFIDNWMAAQYNERAPSDVSTTSAEALQASTELKKAIYNRDHPAVYLLASNPLLITLIAMMYSMHRELPRERASLYDNAIHYLVKTWKEDTTKLTDIEQLFIEESLEQVAFDIHSNFQAGQIRKGDLVGRMIAGCMAAAIKDKEKYVLLMVSKLQESVGLLVEKAPDCFSFIHLSFQEFLAGRRMLRDRSRTADMMLDRLSDPRWREPILLALGHASLTWPRREFNALLSQILAQLGSIGSSNIVPFPAVLVVRALPELGQDSIDKDVVDQLIEILVSSYHALFQSKCKSTSKVIVNSLLRLKEIPQCKRQLLAFLETWISSPIVVVSSAL